MAYTFVFDGGEGLISAGLKAAGVDVRTVPVGDVVGRRALAGIAECHWADGRMTVTFTGAEVLLKPVASVARAVKV